MTHNHLMRFALISLVAMTVICFRSATIYATSRWVEYQSGHDTVRAYMAVPDGEGPFPGLVVIHEWWGLTDWVKANADRFAAQGYAALAIDLYRGRAAQSSDEAHELMRGLPEDRAIRDLKAAVAYLQRSPGVIKNAVGSIGWCMGGGYSLATALNATSLAAAVICYGRLVTETEQIDKIPCPILGVFGEDDKGIPPSSVREFQKNSRSRKKDVEVVIYPGAGHGFMNENNKTGYREKAAEDAWKRIRQFLDANLKAGKKK